MAGPQMIILGALLLAVFLAVVAAMLWQEVRSGRLVEPPTYVLGEAVAFVWERLRDDQTHGLTERDVLRILEWEVHYLQTVGGVAGSDVAVGYIVEQARTEHKVGYREEDVRLVLEQEGAYLAAIGAVGDVVEDA